MENTSKFATDDGFEPARTAILVKALELAAFDGWTASMFDAAVRSADIPHSDGVAAFPGRIGDLLRYWSMTADSAIAEAMMAPGFRSGKVREKVANAVLARIGALAPHKEAARRAAALLAAPHMAGLGVKLTWASADTIWRGLGDKSTDFNFYSKRAILSGVLASTTARWFADETEDLRDTQRFLAARIENVMQIEKIKAQGKKLGRDPAAPISWLAKLRYPTS